MVLGRDKYIKPNPDIKDNKNFYTEDEMDWVECKHGITMSECKTCRERYSYKGKSLRKRLARLGRKISEWNKIRF